MATKKENSEHERLLKLLEKERLPEELYSRLKSSLVGLSEENSGLKKKVISLEEENDILKEQVSFFNELIYGPSSEKLKGSDVGEGGEGEGESARHFNEPEESVDKAPEEGEGEDSEAEAPDKPEKPGKPRKRGKRKPLPKNLPRERIVIDLREEEKVCVHDGSVLKCIGEEVSEKLKIIPAKVVVLETVRKKYACGNPGCSGCLKTASSPPGILPKSMVTPELLAFIVTSKYADSIPLYRMESVMRRHGIELGRATMARWMIKSSGELEPLKQILREELLSSEYIHCDETTVQVLKEEGRDASKKSYIWAQGRSGNKPIILYDYRPSRGADVPEELLSDFRGYVQVDGYPGYNRFCQREGVIRLGCMKHCRRYFHKAWKHSGDKGKKNAAARALGFIKKLYKIEKDSKNLVSEERKKVRQEKAVPVLEKMKVWLDSLEGRYPPKGYMGKAVAYALKEWDCLIGYVEDGRLDIDNDYIERSIRPFVIGRKNWLFSDTPSGADASALWYSLIETAKANGQEPFDYILKVIKGVPCAKTLEDYLKLLPFSVDDS